MAGEGIELGIYHHNDPNQYLDTLEGRQNPTGMDQVGGLGGGSFDISTSDPKIVEDPELIDYRKVVRYKIDGEFVGGFVISIKNSTTIADGEASQEGYNVAGEGFLTWFNDAAIQPLGGVQRTSGKTRSFSFASPVGDWYNPSDWIAPTLVTGRGAPEKWPENTPATWLWNAASGAAAGTCYFRHTFTIATEGNYVIYLAADDFMDVYIDGAQVVASDYATNASSEATKIETHFTAGTHILGIRATTDGGSAGVLESIWLKGVDNVETMVTSSASTAQWKIRAYPSIAPGWTPGEIILTLLEEAEARGVKFPLWLVPTFTSTMDSNGESWGDPYDWTFNIGESYMSILNKITELGIEIWIDPVNFELNMASTRGEFRAEDPNALVFERGKNLRKASSAGVGKIKNSLTVQTAEGWLLDDNEHSGSVGKYGVLEGTLQADVSTEVARALVQAVFAQRATAEEGATYDVIITDDEVPFKDYQAGDWALAPNELGIGVPRRMVSLSFAEGESGNVLYTIEFDTVFTTNEERINKVLNKQAGGGLGSNFNNAAGVPLFNNPIVVTPGTAPIKKPKAPVGLLVTSTGYWSADGVTPYSEVILNWDDVTENTDETETIPAGYEVWAHQTDAIDDDGFQLVTYVTQSQVALRGGLTDTDMELKVRAINDSGQPSAFSVEVSHTTAGPTDPMDAPDDPILTSSKGLLIVTWTGELQGNPPPPQFRYIYAEVEIAPGVWEPMGPTLGRDGRNIAIAGLTVGEEYAVRLYAVDGAKIASAASNSDSIVLTGIELGDLDTSIQDAIDAAHDAAIEAKQSVNMLEDNSFELNTEEFWDLSGTTTNVTTDPRSGLRHLRIEATGSTFDAFRYTRPIRCQPGDQFLIRLYVKNEVLAADPTDDDGLELTIYYGETESTMTETAIIGSSQELTTGDYEPLTGQWTVPDDVFVFSPGLVVTETTSGIAYYIDDIRLLLMVGQTQIIDGAIVADKLAADSVSASKIQAGAIAAVHIQAEAITAEKLAADSVTAYSIAAQAITADAIDVGAVKTSHISSEVGEELNISNNTSIQLVVGQIGNVQDDLNDTSENLEEMQTYYTFGVDGAVVSTPSSPFAVAIRNDRIEMLENGNAVSYWNSGQMYVSQFIGERVILGNHQLEKYSTGTVVRAL